MTKTRTSNTSNIFKSNLPEVTFWYFSHVEKFGKTSYWEWMKETELMRSFPTSVIDKYIRNPGYHAGLVMKNINDDWKPLGIVFRFYYLNKLVVIFGWFPEIEEDQQFQNDKANFLKIIEAATITGDKRKSSAGRNVSHVMCPVIGDTNPKEEPPVEDDDLKEEPQVEDDYPEKEPQVEDDCTKEEPQIENTKPEEENSGMVVDRLMHRGSLHSQRVTFVVKEKTNSILFCLKNVLIVADTEDIYFDLLDVYEVHMEYNTKQPFEECDLIHLPSRVLFVVKPKGSPEKFNIVLTNINPTITMHPKYYTKVESIKFYFDFHAMGPKVVDEGMKTLAGSFYIPDAHMLKIHDEDLIKSILHIFDYKNTGFVFMQSAKDMYDRLIPLFK